MPPTDTAEPIQLPASGLAEDILRQLETPPPAPHTPVEAAEETSEPEAAAPERIELPASGLAEEILGAQRSPAVPGELPPAARAGEATAPAPGSHSLSFFAAPAQEQRATVEATEHLVTFFLDREEYGVDVRQVQEIRRLTEITTVPRAPEFVRGVINLRGRILPVLDLKRKLGLGQVEGDRATRIVVVRVRDRLLGLLVDGASQVPKIPLSRIEAAPEEVVERGGDYIRGVAKLDDRLIILVDLERLLAHELVPASPVSTVRAAAGPEGPSQE
ncbi:MAG TPA: chemotaxis protein CheW [Vicinamibacteria bacterium]|nr:chemotaxis protein CheW [Vicinamibacteria bacterium]